MSSYGPRRTSAMTQQIEDPQEAAIVLGRKSAARDVREALDPVDTSSPVITAAVDALALLAQGPSCLVCRAVGSSCPWHPPTPTAPVIELVRTSAPRPKRALVGNLHTTASVAALADVRPATVLRWIRTGQLEARKRGGRWLVHPSAVRLLMLDRYARGVA